VGISDLEVTRIFVTGSAKMVSPEYKTGKAVKLLSILKSRNIELTSEINADYLLAIDHNKSSLKQFSAKTRISDNNIVFFMDF
jgi:hypothetical protein